MVTGFDPTEFASPHSGEEPAQALAGSVAEVTLPRFFWLIIVAFVVLFFEFGVAPR